MITQLDQPTVEQRTAIESLAQRAATSDGIHPLNDAARLALAGRSSSAVRHFLAGSPAQLHGYAQLDPRDGSVQLVVDPIARRQGIGRELAAAVGRTGQARSWWAFGDLPGAQALAASGQLTVIRRLLIMTLDLAAGPDQANPLPPGFVLDHYRASDLERLVEVNAAAFAHHPEQGALRAADFTARMHDPWHRDRDLLVVRDQTGALIGYHWTKSTGTTGEVYVIGVAPELAGKGIGRALLEAGIIHMRNRGVRLVDLYVEAANERVVHMYREAGFEVTHTDVAYGPAEED